MSDYFIRFGNPPKKGFSGIYRKDKLIGYEKGISCYDACLKDDGWHIVLQNKLTSQSFDTFIYLIRYSKRKVYLIKGNKIGTGNDNEPVIDKDCEIIKQIKLKQ